MAILWISLLVLTLVLYLASLGMITSMHSSDAAGNGLTQSFAFLSTIALWVSLSALLIVAALKGRPSAWLCTTAFLLVPACAAAALASVNLLTDDFYKSKWPILVPALGPILLLACAAWTAFPSVRRTIPVVPMNTFIWGAILLLSLAPWPAIARRKRHRQEDRANAAAQYSADEPKRIEAERQRNLAEFRKLTADSPLRDWLAFRYPSNELREQAFAGMRKLPRRQADAEAMLRQGLDYFWDDLPQLNLEASPVVCESARKFLRERTKDLQPPNSLEPPKFSFMVERIEPYLPTIKWLVEQRCECSSELQALQSTVSLYRECPERTRVLEFLRSLSTSAKQ